MYRSLTGEAFVMLNDNKPVEEIKQVLWACYVIYKEQKKAAEPDNPLFQPKPKKIRRPRKYSEESIQRMLKRKGKDDKPKWRDPEEEERKRQRKAMNDACYQRTMKNTARPPGGIGTDPALAGAKEQQRRSRLALSRMGKKEKRRNKRRKEIHLCSQHTLRH